jgi:phosphoserine phosphatase
MHHFHSYLINSFTASYYCCCSRGFDDKELTCRDGGKPKVVQTLKDAHGYDTMVMIGDGATDMQAKPPASAFIGFGGIAIREKVRDGADWFVTDFQVRLCQYVRLLAPSS